MTSAPAPVPEALCRRFRGVVEAKRDRPEADERRNLAGHHTGDAWLSVALDADVGARLLAAHDLARFDVSAETPHRFDVSAETPHRFDVSAETCARVDVSAETPHRFDVSAETWARVDVSAETPHRFDVSAETPYRFDVSAETPYRFDVSAETCAPLRRFRGDVRTASTFPRRRR